MKRLVAILVSLIVLVTGISCSKGDKKPRIERTVLILLDLSESAMLSRKDYRVALEKILKSTRVGDHIAIRKITEFSEMEPEPLLDNSFLPKEMPSDFFKNREINRVKKEMEDFLGRGIQSVSMYIDGRKHPEKKTAIFGSLQIAEKVFKNDGNSKAILVVMSDMIEDSSDYNFEKITLSGKAIDNIINREKQRGRLPDLKGVKVYVYGPRAGSRNKYYEIQNFWLRYFKECGAEIGKEDYGSTVFSIKE